MANAARIIGLARLKRKMERMPQIAQQSIKAALETSANEIVALMKNLVPVLKEPDARRKAGALRDSIGWTWGKAPKGTMTLGKVAESKLAGAMTITIYAGSRSKSKGTSDAFYARWVEFGTQSMRAQPYFYPAYRANKKSTKRRIKRSITQAAKRVANS